MIMMMIKVMKVKVIMGDGWQDDGGNQAGDGKIFDQDEEGQTVVIKMKVELMKKKVVKIMVAKVIMFKVTLVMMHDEGTEDDDGDDQDDGDQGENG